MKNLPTPKVLSAAPSVMLTLTLCGSLRVAAQTVQYVTINCPTGMTNYSVQPNQLISIVGCNLSAGNGWISGNLTDGSTIGLNPVGSTVLNTYGAVPTAASVSQMATGLTNLIVANGMWATFEIKTPGAQKTTFDYVPADCVVVPTSASGTVNIILESSADLQNWSAAMPGSYNPVGQTNRFFRGRAVGNP